MPLITSRIPFSYQNPYRPVRPATSKIIFLSFEGSVTEEEYFDQISNLFQEMWNEAIAMCQEKNYGYAVSNPFFEVWLLLHHDNPDDADKGFAVTDIHGYEKTDHFRNRLRDLGVPLKDKKHIDSSHYNTEKVKLAISRAEALHVDKTDLCPRYFATTVYMLLNKIMEMVPGAS